MLHRLIYSSKPAQPLDEGQVTAILATARRNNERHDITGMLVFDSQAFLQVIEGERGRLSTLFSTLVRDPRHCELAILSMGPVEERAFSTWQMGFAAAHPGHRSLFLKHGASRHFEPGQMSAPAALALVKDLAQAAG